MLKREARARSSMTLLRILVFVPRAVGSLSRVLSGRLRNEICILKYDFYYSIGNSLGKLVMRVL